MGDHLLDTKMYIYMPQKAEGTVTVVAYIGEVSVVYTYGMGHKKVPVSCFLKSRFLAVQRKRNVWNTARSVPR